MLGRKNEFNIFAGNINPLRKLITLKELTPSTERGVGSNSDKEWIFDKFMGEVLSCILKHLVGIYDLQCQKL